MNQAVVLIAGIRGNTFTVKPREQRCGAGSVEALVVIEDFNPQTATTPQSKNPVKPED
jgi:hypothetical protein